MSLNEDVPKRCQLDGCKIKLKLSDYKCKCDMIYCTSHRYPEIHKCTYDFKLEGIRNLEKNLIQVIGQKIEKI